MEETTKTNILLGVIVIALAIGGAIWLGGDNKVENNEVEQSTLQDSSKTSEFKTAFVGGCLGEGGGLEYCSCTYDSLIKNMGVEGLMYESIDYMEAEKLSDNLKAELVKAIKECI